MGPQGAQGDPGPAGPAGQGVTGNVYRWAVFNPLDWNSGPMAQNTASLFGGVAPTSWYSGGVTAASISANKELQRTLFTQKGYPGRNAMVYAKTEMRGPTATDTTIVAVLFRIRNSTADPITWVPNYMYSSNSLYNHSASCAVNGANVFVSTAPGATAYTTASTASFSAVIDPNSVATMICISASGPFSSVSSIYGRQTVMAFVNNSLGLPAGLQFVDDLESATGGWGQ